MAQVQWNSALEVSRWAKELFTSAKKDTYFSRFFGGSNSAIHVLNDLKAAKGKDVTVGLKMKIEGSGITGDNTLAGNEVAIDTYSQTVTLDQLRQGVLSTGKMHDKKTLIDFRKEALDSLKVWFAETMEADLITALSATPTYQFFCNPDGTNTHTDAAPASTVVAADTIGAKPISRLVARAKILNPKIRPIRVNGKDYYVLILHPEAAHELKNQSDFKLGPLSLH